VQAAAPAPASTPVQAPAVAAAPAPAANLDDLLANAGLTLASTDPHKLRAAQEAAAQAAPAERPRRTRRATPPPADEPLIQVDTRQ
jgi:ribonuclease E